MTQRKKLKRRIRHRQGKTLERYTTARRQILKSEGTKQNPRRPERDLEGIARIYTTSATRAIREHDRMLQRVLEGAAFALQRHLLTSPALAIQRKIDEQIAATRAPLMEMERRVREIGELLMDANPALAIQRQIDEQIAAARAALEETQRPFRQMAEQLTRQAAVHRWGVGVSG